MSSFEQRVQKLKHMQLILVAVCLVVLIGYVYFINRPATDTFVLRDECGQIGGVVSHPIANKDVCQNVCTAQCLTRDMVYESYQFEVRDPACNYCECTCKETFK